MLNQSTAGTEAFKSFYVTVKSMPPKYFEVQRDGQGQALTKVIW